MTNNTLLLYQSLRLAPAKAEVFFSTKATQINGAFIDQSLSSFCEELQGGGVTVTEARTQIGKAHRQRSNWANKK